MVQAHLPELTPAHNWLVYMILTSDDQVYTGITTDMRRRWQAHESGRAGARYFRGRKPKCLCFLEDGYDRSGASKREYALKTLTAKAKRLLITQQQDTSGELLMKYDLQHLAGEKSQADATLIHSVGL